jgi:hypothetical protein
MVLKIFSDRSYISAGISHVTILYPFWGKNPENLEEPISGRFDRYLDAGRTFFEMTTLEKADLAVFPGAWEQIVGDLAAVERAEQFIEMARQAHKPTVIFFWSDSAVKVPYDNIVVFRTSLYRSRQRCNEFAMPAWSEDFVAKHLSCQLQVRSKGSKAVVGFCGQAPSSDPRLTRYSLKWAIGTGVKKFLTILGLRKNEFIRLKALRALAACPLIETNFEIRKQFFGNMHLSDGSVDVKKMQLFRREYVQNSLESDYVLCVRGGGNFSYRLYETLSCGRIPVFVDTDCVLPYDSEIKWKDYCVWVDEKDVHLVGEKIAEFHESLSIQQFEELQRKCRKLWETYLCPEGFFSNFYKHF